MERDRLVGGDGNDFIDGNQGATLSSWVRAMTRSMGSGDGSDTVEGGPQRHDDL
jgi:Ca2+-binding RTX toxin-like protein